MTLKNMLLALDGAPPSEAALKAAVAMQTAYDAHLTGFVAQAGILRQSMAENTWLPSAIASTLRRSTEQAAAAMQARFREATQDLNPERIHLVTATEGSDTSVAEASRFFDVTLVGIPETSSRNSSLHPDRIALLSGRPVIAFPTETDTSRVAERVMIAWDGSRAAARALSSAIRLLDTKDEITIVTIGEPPRAETVVPGLDPKTALERQGLTATWLHAARKHGEIAADLLAQADVLGADLIVMGAFEHSKFREDLLGGVTHDVMAHTKIPVFLAH